MDYYLLLSHTQAKFPLDVKQYRSLDLTNLSKYIKSKAFQEHRDEILERFIADRSINKFLELYITDKEAIDTFVRHCNNWNIQLSGVNEKLAASVILSYSRTSNHLDFGNSENEFIKRLYYTISIDKRKQLDINLLKNHVFLSYVIKDIINKIHSDDNSDLLEVLFNVSFVGDSYKKDKFKKLVDNALPSDYNYLISLLKIIANDMDDAPGEGGKILFDSLITKISLTGHDFSDEFTKRETKNIEQIFGKAILSRKGQASSNGTGSLLKYAALGIGLMLLVVTLVYFLSPEILDISLGNSTNGSSLWDGLFGNGNATNDTVNS
jgi:hypothetical protein